MGTFPNALSPGPDLFIVYFRLFGVLVFSVSVINYDKACGTRKTPSGSKACSAGSAKVDFSLTVIRTRASPTP